VKEFPFGPEVVVFKVGGKMFALVAWEEDPLKITLKSPPEEAEFLRSTYAAVSPGYHMNKRHWNTVTLDGSLPQAVLEEMIETSYSLVVGSLPRKVRQALPGQ
ncbi:MAG: MmcQ/YjbR family DNA-binding protein, partial [Anaerolineae bacterium]